MIEIRSSHIVHTKDIRDALVLWREGREKVFPHMGKTGRVQQLTHGHIQQSVFVCSMEWNNLSEWETTTEQMKDSDVYTTWMGEIKKLAVYGEESEIFRIFEPRLALDNTPGKVEIRSCYKVKLPDIDRALELFRHMQEVVWPVFGWQGQNQQMLHGKAAQSMLVWASIWDSIDTWEKSMAKTYDSVEFQSWYKDWLGTVDFGSTREIFKNL